MKKSIPYTEQDDEILKMARRVLYRCIYELKEEVRELLFSIAILEPVPIQGKLPLLTNGKELYYSPLYVLETEKEKLKQEILHIVMHGLFGHFEEDRHLTDTELAWAVMDIQAERMSSLLRRGQSAAETKDQGHRRMPIGMELYYRAVKNPRLREKVLKRGQELKRDDHIVWRMEPLLLSGGSGASNEWEEAREALLGISGSKAAAGKGSGKNISGSKAADAAGRSVEKQLEEALKGIGSQSGSSDQTVREQLGRTTDYQALLASLRTLGTTCGEEDAPDFMYYSYGLELYGDMPLVEPLEEGEYPSLDTVVVAVDTSGSCMSKLPHFLHETRKLLMQLKTTTKVSRVWYMECDAEIQREEMHDGAETDKALSGEYSYRGGGGTDFRPVFQRLAEYENQGGRISCLLYYTDGNGTYPETEADFPCYFISSDGFDRPWVRLPEWITGVQLK